MANELKALIVDSATGEVIERNLNADEIAYRNQVLAENESNNAEIQSKAIARQSALVKLAALGLTEEEIAAL
jgi:hypothetical protein